MTAFCNIKLSQMTVQLHPPQTAELISNDGIPGYQYKISRNQNSEFHGIHY